MKAFTIMMLVGLVLISACNNVILKNDNLVNQQANICINTEDKFIEYLKSKGTKTYNFEWTDELPQESINELVELGYIKPVKHFTVEDYFRLEYKKHLSDFEICKKTNLIDSCKLNLMDETFNTCLCEEIDDDHYKQQCYYKAALILKDSTYCDKMTLPFLEKEKNQCYQNVCDENGLDPACDKIDSNIGFPCVSQGGMCYSDNNPPGDGWTITINGICADGMSCYKRV